MFSCFTEQVQFWPLMVKIVKPHTKKKSLNFPEYKDELPSTSWQKALSLEGD